MFPMALNTTQDTAIMEAVCKSDRDSNLIGDFSKCHALPLIVGKHQDLKSISPETLVDLMNGHYSDIIHGYAIVDCRYPYEYDGGHVAGAFNIFSTDVLVEKFFSENCPSKSPLIIPPPNPKCVQESMAIDVQAGTESPLAAVKRTALIFHCEFSSKRGPKLYRFLRSKDREANQASYPKLNYPEIYILDGGYKAFYEKFPDHCVPKCYTPMDTDVKACRHFQAKTKASWRNGSRGGENAGTTTLSGMPYRVLKRPSLKPRNFQVSPNSSYTCDR